MNLQNIKIRFESKFTEGLPDDCWEWTGSKVNGRYGKITKGSATEGLILAHRLAYILKFGPIPDDIDVLHKCDNPGCVNWNHLFLGTQKDNVVDMYSKGRNNSNGPKGEKNRAAELTEEEVIEIRKLLAERKLFQKEIGNLFGVSQMCVSKINTGRTWGHIS